MTMSRLIRICYEFTEPDYHSLSLCHNLVHPSPGGQTFLRLPQWRERHTHGPLNYLVASQDGMDAIMVLIRDCPDDHIHVISAYASETHSHQRRCRLCILRTWTSSSSPSAFECQPPGSRRYPVRPLRGRTCPHHRRVVNAVCWIERTGAPWPAQRAQHSARCGGTRLNDIRQGGVGVCRSVPARHHTGEAPVSALGREGQPAVAWQGSNLRTSNRKAASRTGSPQIYAARRDTQPVASRNWAAM